MTAMMIREVLAACIFAAAVLFGTAGVIGLFRFPDPYSRLQASALCGTTAVLTTCVGALLLAPSWAVASRVIVIIIFFLFSAPTGSHIVARFAWNAGTPVWRPDRLRTLKGRRKAP